MDVIAGTTVASALAVFRCDESGHCVEVNEAWKDLTGRDKPLANDPLACLGPVSPRDHEDVCAAWNECRVLRQPMSIEYRMQRADSSVTWVLAQCVPTANEGESTSLLIGTLTDIDRWKRQQQPTEVTRAYPSELMDTFPVVVFECDDKGIVRYCNAFCEDVFGYTKDEVVDTLALSDLIAPEDHPRLLDVLQQRISGENVGRSEYTAIRKDGSRFPVLTYTSSIHLPGQPPRIRGTVFDISERVLAEEALRDSEERYRKLVNLAPISIVVHHNDTLCFANRSAAKVFGVESPDSLVGQSVLSLIHPDDREFVRQRSEAILLSGEASPPAVIRIVRPDGSLVHVESSATSVIYDGKLCIQAILLDVSKRVEEDLEKARRARHIESLERIGRVISGASDIDKLLDQVMETVFSIFDCDRAWLVYPCDPHATTWSAPVEKAKPEFLGAFRMGAEIPMNAAYASICEDMLATDRPLMRGGTSGKPIGWSHGEFSVRSLLLMALHPRGSKAWGFGLHQCSTNRDWTDEEQVLFEDIAHRITDALSMFHTFKQLSESEERLRLLAENTPGAVYLSKIDKNFTPIYLNDKVEEITGYPKSDFLEGGLRLRDLIHPEEFNAVWRSGREALRKGKPYTLRFRLNHADGTIRWVDLFGVGVVDKTTGNLQYLEGFMHDVTEQKREEVERQRLEAQMVQTQKLESLGVLGGGIAHDFNNILMAILGNVSLALTDVPQGSRKHKYLKDIENASERAAELCNQLLAYSGKRPFMIEPVDLAALVRDTATLLDVSISKKANLVYSHDDSLPMIEVDPSQLRQVIMNLIINASESLDENEGTIQVTTGVMTCDEEWLKHAFSDEKTCPGEFVYFSVEDTGSGMESEDMQKIFDPFFTTKFTGRGLGLAAVLGIVRGHRGAIDVKSAPGEGTQFTVCFPATVAEDLRQPLVQPSADDWHSEGTVLIVDDEEMVREVSRDMLERIGFSVLTAVDGREALDTFDRWSDIIRLVLLDLTMPHLSGDEVFSEMHSKRPDIPVIISSGYDAELRVGKFSGIGPSGFIQKPYNAQDLYDVVREALEPSASSVSRQS